MMMKCAPLLLACWLGTPALADCLTLPNALPPTADAERLAARLSKRLPLASKGMEVSSVSACGSSVYFDYPEIVPQRRAIAPSNRLPDAERVICIDYFTRQFIKDGGSVKGIMQLSFPIVFDLCEGF
jgi:hypothetical protein